MTHISSAKCSAVKEGHSRFVMIKQIDSLEGNFKINEAFLQALEVA